MRLSSGTASQSAKPPSLWTPITFMRWQQVRLAAPAGAAGAAGNIRKDRDLLADAEAARPGDRRDLAAELVADHARIFEIGLRALENMQVGAAHACPPYAHQRRAWRSDRRRALDEGELARAGAEQGSHNRDPIRRGLATVAC